MVYVGKRMKKHQAMDIIAALTVAVKVTRSGR